MVPRSSSRWPTGSAWLAFAITAVLRALPFTATRAISAGGGDAFLPIGFIPKDWCQYVALIREPSVPGSLALANPFTTEQQSGRFVLLLHQALRAVYRATGIDPFWLVELSRPVLLACLLCAFWQLLRLVFHHDRERTWAAWLLALSGGFGALVGAFVPVSPSPLHQVVRQDLWTMMGWTAFEALYNPLWIAGLSLLFLLLCIVLAPGGVLGVRESAVAAVLWIALWFTHVYSALAALAIVAAVPAVEACAGAVRWREHLGRAAALLPAVAVVGAITMWQLLDPVFRASSGGILGTQLLPSFWYPFAYGALGFLALRGLGAWTHSGHPWRHALVAWIAAAALLHASPLINGYHFVAYLYPALCIAAAPVVADLFARARATRLPWLAACALGAVLFSSPVIVTIVDCRAALSESRVPVTVVQLLQALSTRRPGNVLSPPEFGNLIPAFGPHRVYVGHWFMTPGFGSRSSRYWSMVNGGDAAATELTELVRDAHIDYLVLPADSLKSFAPILANSPEHPDVFGPWALVSLRAR